MNSCRSLDILMTADAVGGVWQYATDLAAELGAAGHTVTLALIGPPPSAVQREQVGAIANVRLVETGLPLDWLSAGPEPVRAAAEEIAHLAAQTRADVVHCNTPCLAGAADFTAPVVAVAHGCLATWWQAARQEALPEEFRWHGDMTRRGLAVADAVIAPSASFAKTIQTTYDLPAPPLCVHNGRRPLTEPAADISSLTAALTVGRLWDEVKNARVLDEAAGRLATPFLAAGPLRGPHGEEFSPARLRALGHLETNELATLLSLRPVFVSAASFEPFGLAVLEAAAAGCPLVLADIATFRELWDGSALFVEPNDAEAFACAIASLMDNRPAARALGRAASERARRYTPSAAARRMEQIYASVRAPAEAAA